MLLEELEFTNNCESCGAQCCKNWNIARFDPSMSDENGVCIYLDKNTNLCTIYDDRPIFCRVYQYFTQVSNMPFEQMTYHAKQGCKALQKMSKRREANDYKM